ncbi:MAG: hypothetical protein Fur009_4370 [Candidatus Microgenomates bacterium]
MTIKILSSQEINSFYAFFEKLMKENFGFYQEKVINHFLTKIYTRENLKYWIKNNYRIILTADDEKNYLGFAMIDAPYGGVSLLRFLAVDKTHQKKGVGKALILKWEEIAKNQDCHKLEVAAYPLVEGFYKKCGFVSEGLRKNSYFGINQVIMGKVIGQFDSEKL